LHSPPSCPTLHVMSTSKTQRWLDLLSVLVGRRFPVAVDEIMEQVPAYRDRWETGDPKARASVRRMFERDKDELRGMGIPLETRRYRLEGLADTQGYVIPTRDLPPLPEARFDWGRPRPRDG
jgi:proteasome accessory factor B